jgi:hypothetical protein
LKFWEVGREKEGERKEEKKRSIGTQLQRITPHMLPREVGLAMTIQKRPRNLFFATIS